MAYFKDKCCLFFKSQIPKKSKWFEGKRGEFLVLFHTQQYLGAILNIVVGDLVMPGINPFMQKKKPKVATIYMQSMHSSLLSHFPAPR